MKKYILSALCALSLIACAKSDEDMVAVPATAPETIYASFEEPTTRTYVEQDKYLRWHAEDEISFFSTTYNLQYRFQGNTGDNNGSFTKITTDLVTGNALANNYAVYPYAASTAISDEGVISVTLPATQAYAENSFGRGANTMVAATNGTMDNVLRFKNAGGYLKLQLYGTDVTVKSVALQGNKGEKIAGEATITAAYGNDPVVTMADTATDVVTIDCGEGVTLSNDATTPTTFWFVLPETTFAEGFTVTVTDTEGGTFVKSTSNSFTIDRNMIQPMKSLEAVVEGEEIIEGPANNEIWYTSTDGKIIEPFTSTPVRCGYVDNVTYTTNVYNDAGYGVMSFQSDISQINSQAFFNNTNLQTIILPESVEIINGAAFQGCSNLENIHIGAAMTKINNDAFRDCSNLNKVDITDLSAWCSINFGNYATQPLYYAHKLYMHNSLVEELIIPEDVTSIGDLCFYYCESINNLCLSSNISTIKSSAFSGCSNITKITIPSNVETVDTYAFRGCSGLVEIEIESGVKSIGLGAFMECKNLLRVLCKGATPPTGNSWMFNSNASNRKIYVPASDDMSVINAYKTAYGWKDYADYMVEYEFTE